MKVLKLNLLAFGPFSGQVLDFDKANASFHVVYGANEAGKSSSLRALRQCLYGIPRNCTDNFIHPNSNLRIGGVLKDEQGKQLEFIRRKGQDKTLRGPDDIGVIDPAELARMLGGIDQASFCQRFGIGYEELREGGRAIVDGGGELGTILFAAGAGIADIRQVQSRIEAELQELFKPSGSNPRINKTLADLKAARDQIREAQLPTSRWIDEDKALRAARKRRDAADRDLLDKKTRKGRLERLTKALPLIINRRHWSEQLATVADVPLLPEDFTSDRREALSRLATAQQDEQEASTEIKKLQALIAGVNVPQGLLERQSAISHLLSGLGSYQKAAKDRPGLVILKGQADERATQILQELGREPSLPDADKLRLTKLQRQRIHELATECKSRVDKHTTAEAASKRLVADIKTTEALVTSLAATCDADGLKQVIRQAQKHGDLDQQLHTARGTLLKLEAEAQVELRQLPIFNGTLDQLEQMPVCDAETIDRFENHFKDATSAITSCEERIEELNQKLQLVDGQLEVLRLAHDVPTEIDLTDARRQRNAGWQLIRTAITDSSTSVDPLAKEFVERFALGTDLPQAFQVSVERADVIADRLRHEADRVAEKASLTADHSERTEQIAREQGHLEHAKRHLLALQEQWREQWISLRADPLPPREMRSWLRRQQSLRDKSRSIRTQASVVAEKSALVDSLRAAVSKQLQLLNQALPSADGLLGDLLASSEAIISSTETANRKREECQQKLSNLIDKLVTVQEEAIQAASDLQKWNSGWAEAVAVVGLDENATTSEAISVVQSIDDLLVQFKESAGLVQRIDGIDHDASAFKDEVRGIIAEVAPDLSSLSVDLAVSDLSDRLNTATGTQARLDEWKEQLSEQESKHNNARLAVERWQADVKSMCVTAKCASIEALPEIEQRSSLRRKSEDELASIKEQLAALAAGEPAETFITDAEAAPLEDMQTELQQLVNATSELEIAKLEIAQEIGGHQTEMKRMDGNGRAAEAQGQVEHLLAVVRSDVDQYVRLRLAATALKRSIDRYRENSQGPVVDRAGAIFADVTLGSFSGLRVDYDDKGKASLVGVRTSSGRSVNVENMSDGTCDQLYLALRLALLESYLSEHEPIPFIVDDILVQFDDARAIASLNALAKLSTLTQVIFFTHHEHLVELTRRHVDANVQFTHRL